MNYSAPFWSNKFGLGSLTKVESEWITIGHFIRAQVIQGCAPRHQMSAWFSTFSTYQQDRRVLPSGSMMSRRCWGCGAPKPRALWVSLFSPAAQMGKMQTRKVHACAPLLSLYGTHDLRGWKRRCGGGRAASLLQLPNWLHAGAIKQETLIWASTALLANANTKRTWCHQLFHLFSKDKTSKCFQ